MAKRAPKGTPTGTNLFALWEITADGTKEIPARVEQVHVEHLRRCLRAGLLEQTTAGTFTITAAGRTALDGWKTARGKA
jgi:hypothetical protein